MSKYERITKLLYEINGIAQCAQSHKTQHPLFYDIIGRTEEIEQLTKPWHLKLKEKFYPYWVRLFPTNLDNNLPF